jgi:UDPglucose--hexose-1-phosphate uridylyltransferase
MSEFRQNMATKEWVILSADRGKRPSDFIKDNPRRQPVPPYKDDCPFCKGNEHLTVEPTLVYSEEGQWKVRVVPNKYAALQPDQDTRRACVGSFLTAHGFGIAEVVIEHPRHDLTLARMTVDDVATVLRAYRDRQQAISRNPNVNLVTIFRNHGPRAGTSLMHPHSQIIATPIVPPHVRNPWEQAVMYYDEHGHCVYCDMMKEEIAQKVRIITETDHFVAYCPFAARSPFEARLYPKRHMPSFVSMQDDEITEMAGILRDLLARLYHCLDDPDYNFIIRSAAIGDEDVRYLHWYMVVIPKVSIPAGFEMGSGIYINSVAPEDSALCLRETHIDHS